MFSMDIMCHHDPVLISLIYQEFDHFDTLSVTWHINISKLHNNDLVIKFCSVMYTLSPDTYRRLLALQNFTLLNVDQ